MTVLKKVKKSQLAFNVRLLKEERTIEHAELRLGEAHEV